MLNPVLEISRDPELHAYIGSRRASANRVLAAQRDHLDLFVALRIVVGRAKRL